jgi:ribose/xylose/arabinose/galactoside ABC-type transport system permease subunit
MPPLRTLFRSSAGRALVSLALVLAVGALFNAEGAFFRWDTHRDMLRQVSVYGILAAASTIVIVTGGIDLSVGSILGLSAVLFSLFSIRWGWGAFPSVVLTILAGALCGLASGVVIGRFKAQPFIVTLAMMVFARGLAKLVSSGQKVSTAIQMSDGSYTYGTIPRIFDVVGARIWNDNVATVTLLMAAVLVLSWVFLVKTGTGREMYAIGGNEEAARFAGVPVGRTLVIAYVLSGLLCTLAGIAQAAQELQGDPEAGATYELSAIAMVVIGGTSLRGGTGGIALTVPGILIIGYLEKILSINAVGEETRLMLTGVIILGAVLFQRKGAVS